jgi:hypothetical protein
VETSFLDTLIRHLPKYDSLEKKKKLAINSDLQ